MSNNTNHPYTEEQIKNALDGRTTAEKIGSGDFSSLGVSDLKDVNGAAGWFRRADKIAGRGITSAIPGLGLIDTTIASAVAAKSAKNEEIIISYFSNESMRQLAMSNPLYRKKMEELDNRWYEAGKMATVSFAGGSAGGALTALLLTPLALIPPVFMAGTIAGAMAGGMLANKTYSAAFIKEGQDPIAITMQAARMYADGHNVEPVVIGAALAANLEGSQGEHARRILKSFTGKETYAEALADPNSTEKLHAMMHDPIIDGYIRAQSGMIFDLKDSSKPVAVQYAELINSGKLDVSKILEPGAGMYATITPPAIPVNPFPNAGKNTDIAMPSVPYAGQQGNQRNFVG